jgi:hypothetical protein
MGENELMHKKSWSVKKKGVFLHALKRGSVLMNWINILKTK